MKNLFLILTLTSAIAAPSIQIIPHSMNPTTGTSILKGDGAGGIANATSATDYAPATTGSSILKGNGAGAFANAVAGTDYSGITTGTTILKGNGAGGFNPSTNGLDFYIPVASSVIMVEDEFLDNNNSTGTGFFPWVVTVNSGQWGQIAGLAGHPGVKQLSTLASASSAPQIGTYNSGMLFGTDQYENGWLVRTPAALSDGTDTYMLFAGFGDATTSALSVDAAYIIYRNDINSGKWTGVTSNNSVTNVMTGGSGGTTVVVSTWYFLQTRVNPAATQVDFYVNGTLIGSSTAQIPAGVGRALGSMCQIVKSLGGNARTFDVDYYYHYIKLTTPRFTYPAF